MKVYEAIHNAFVAMQNCDESGNDMWHARWRDRLSCLESELPEGSGFDNGTTIDLGKTKPDRIVLQTSFHHMDEFGGYDGWTEHEVWVEPTFGGIAIKVKGPNRNEIKDFIHCEFECCLNEEAPAMKRYESVLREGVVRCVPVENTNTKEV